MFVSESFFGKPRRSHPEVMGRELETVPVTQRTLQELKDTFDAKSEGHFLFTITSGDNNYQCANAQDLISINQQIGQTLLTYNVLERRFLNKKHFVIRKFEIVQPEIVESDAITDRRSLLNDIQNKTFDALKASERDSREMERLTGLPHVSEAEIRQLIMNLRSGSLHVII